MTVPITCARPTERRPQGDGELVAAIAKAEKDYASRFAHGNKRVQKTVASCLLDYDVQHVHKVLSKCAVIK
jgi:hypothetical protein